MSAPEIPNDFTLHIPDPITLSATATINPSPFALKVGGIANAPVVVDLGLDDISLELVGNPAEPVTVDLGLDDIKADLGLDNIKADLGLDNVNAKLSLALTQIPSVRINIPTQYEFAFNLLGIKLFSFCFSGKTAITTEDNPPVIRHSVKDLSREKFERLPLREIDATYTVTIDDTDEAGNKKP